MVAVAPPHAVIALRTDGVPAATLPDETAMDHPPAGGFASIILGGKAVRRGPPALIEQSDALRGSPYLYDVGNVRYIVIADDQDWAAAALAQLP